MNDRERDREKDKDTLRRRKYVMKHGCKCFA